jgi:hypothetical protein
MEEKFNKLISELNSDIVCSAIVGAKIADSLMYVADVVKPPIKEIGDEKYKIGLFNTKNVFVDPRLS